MRTYGKEQKRRHRVSQNDQPFTPPSRPVPPPYPRQQALLLQPSFPSTLRPTINSKGTINDSEAGSKLTRRKVWDRRSVEPPHWAVLGRAGAPSGVEAKARIDGSLELISAAWRKAGLAAYLEVAPALP